MGTNTNHNPGSNPAPKSPQGSGNNTGMAILAYLGILILVPFLSEAKNDPYVKFHIKQGLALIIVEVAGLIIIAIPVLGWFLSPILWLASLIFVIIGIMNASSGKTKELPVIGSIARSFNF